MTERISDYQPETQAPKAQPPARHDTTTQDDVARYALTTPRRAPAGPCLGSYSDATGSVSVACGCAVYTLPRGVVVASPCLVHAGQMVVEMRPREMVGTEVSAHVHE